MALGAFAMVVVLTVLTIIARNGYGRANPSRRFRRLLPPRGSTSGVAAPGQGDANAAKPRLRRGCLAGALEGTKAAASKPAAEPWTTRGLSGAAFAPCLARP